MEEQQAAIEQLIQKGELEDARTALLEVLGESDDPGTMLLAAILETQLERFDAAATLLRKLASDRPDWRTLAQEVGLCVDADRERTLRRTDPDMAAQRAGIGPPPPYAQAQLEGLVYHARGEHEQARLHFDAAVEECPEVMGRVVRTSGNVAEFSQLIDSDALTGPMLVAIGPRGVLDIPWTDLAVVELMPGRTYHDLLWPVARVVTHSGDRFKVRIPALYPGTGSDEMAAVRSGSMTIWDRDHGYPIARGQRDLHFRSTDSDGTIGLRQIARIEIEHIPEVFQ